MIRLSCVGVTKLVLFLIPLLSIACGTLEVGIERSATPEGAATPMVEVLATENPYLALYKTPTPTPEGYIPPTPVPAFTPMPVDAYPAPAGLRVAFVKDGNIWLWTAEGPALSEVEGRETIPLTSAGDASGILKISDDGAVVAFIRREEEELWVVNAFPEQSRRSDGTGERQLLSAEDLEAMEPENGFEVRLNRFEWVPGTHIVAFNTRLRLEARDVPANDLRLINADTLEQSILLPPGEGGEFYYSPDGSQIAIVTPGDISLIDAGGGNRRDDALTYTPVMMYSESDYYVQPTWAADGSSLMVAIPPANPQTQPTQHTTIWRIPTNGTSADLITSIYALPIEGAIAFSHELNYVAYGEMQQSGTTPTEGIQIWLKVMRLENGDWVSYAAAATLYGWAPNSRRFAFVSGRQRPQLQIGQWSGRTLPGSVAAGTLVSDVRWVDADHYLFVARRDWEKGADGDSFDILLGDIDGSSTVLASMGDEPLYDFAIVPPAP